MVECVGRMLRKTLSDELATSFSLWGKKGNINFSATNLYSILKGKLRYFYNYIDKNSVQITKLFCLQK